MERAIRRLGVAPLAACAAVAGCAATGTTTAHGTASATAAASRAASAASTRPAQIPVPIVVSTAPADDASFWLAPGQPPAVLAWEQAHLPRRFTPQDEGFGPPRPPGEHVPSVARVVTIVALPSMMPGARQPPVPVTITAAAVVARLAALAVAEGPAPCGTVLFTVGGRQQPALQVPDGFVSQVLAIAGLRWRLS